MKGGNELGDVNSRTQLAPYGHRDRCAIIDHLLTLLFATQFFPPSLEDKRTVADKTVNAIGFTRLP